MKVFKFKLETVLQVKEKREEKLQAELGLLQDLYKQQVESLAILGEKQLSYQAQLAENSEAQLQIQNILAHLEYLKFIAAQISQQEDELLRLTADLEEKRTHLVEASQERQLLERVKEREHKVYLGEFRREEQRALDEMAQLGFLRKEAGI